MKILFVSRAYPPVTGGIENQNYALSVWLKKVATADTIANRKGKKALPFFFPYALLRMLFSAPRYDVILLGDGVLALLGYIVKCMYPKKLVVSIVHGLDLTYKNAFYQKYWVKKFIPSLDGLIAVSSETKKVALEKGISSEKVMIIHNGVETEAFFHKYTREDLSRVLKRDISNTFILLTAGRLAKRKGAEWFIRNVLPLLSKDTLYVLAGDGPERENIEKAIEETDMKDQVLLLGRVSDEDRNILLGTVDIFIQPNIPVPGDMEGFGIAVIEATSAGRPVIASNLEGLKDAISHNENGILVTPEDARAFKEAIETLKNNPEERALLGQKAHTYTEKHYHWQSIASRYTEVLSQFIK